MSQVRRALFSMVLLGSAALLAGCAGRRAPPPPPAPGPTAVSDRLVLAYTAGTLSPAEVLSLDGHTRVALGDHVGEVACSPDGRIVALTPGSPAGGNVEFAALTTADRSTAAPGGGVIVTSLRWAPDSTRVYFIGLGPDSQDGVESYPAPSSLWLASPGMEWAARVSSPGENVIDACWSPSSGNLIYWTLDWSNGRVASKSVWPGGETFDLGGAACYRTGPVLSPDGSMLAWLTGPPGVGACCLEVTTTGKEAAQARLTDSVPDDATLPLSYAWAPDSSHIAYAPSPSGRHRVVLFDIAQGSERELAPAESGDYGLPTWSLDGERIACVRQLSDTFEVRVVDVVHGGETVVCSRLGKARSLQWIGVPEPDN